ncbi:hypothetical protein [Burkholderia ambifaria]|uniref:hypothetical protein n=1 Tax=Burkholderia ambifaria TaxID=152480 RepID=UPI00158BD0FB|nr:hypothetical protein [Burkholderia ambifaria]
MAAQSLIGIATNISKKYSAVTSGNLDFFTASGSKGNISPTLPIAILEVANVSTRRPAQTKQSPHQTDATPRVPDSFDKF